ncbi:MULTISPECIES: Cof-type HAD-IIB family hydrolase [Sphingomonadaceae]|uniref:Cof-type HAD-IIB family hydrolase n=1 Tax=Sphingomonadales TaxID=204457 RepID=UPI0007702CA7|nr:Cof-type HAD-IIB family hydrolase [Sphingobium sp. TKS]AMK22956.1 Cof-like hydrolase family protein [Sphingobium sp. TKS]MCF8706695.1 Cof-type HAD-IIB family hydrolase [Rhizorhapis sp. SPR117]
MSAIRLVVSDIDGTLVRDDKSLSEAVIASCGRLQAAGVALTLISARPPSGMLWIAERLGLKAAFGAFNGGTIVRPDGMIMAAARLDPAVAKRALTLIDRPGITKWLFREGCWHAERLDQVHTPRERKAANQEPIVGSDFSQLLDAADKIVAVSDDHAMLAVLEIEVANALGRDATVARSQTYYLDITALAANKGDGVAALARAAGVRLEEVAVIGDQRNDLPMFARAGLSIAMAQGPEEVREAADHVTRSNDEDGVAHAIDEILLPMAARG